MFAFIAAVFLAATRLAAPITIVLGRLYGIVFNFQYVNPP
jgi:hypothetical protein